MENGNTNQAIRSNSNEIKQDPNLGIHENLDQQYDINNKERELESSADINSGSFQGVADKYSDENYSNLGGRVLGEITNVGDTSQDHEGQSGSRNNKPAPMNQREIDKLLNKFNDKNESLAEIYDDIRNATEGNVDNIKGGNNAS